MTLLEKSWFGLLAWIFVIAGFSGLYCSWKTSEWLQNPVFEEMQIGYGFSGHQAFRTEHRSHFIMTREAEKYYLPGNVDAKKLDETLRGGDMLDVKVTLSPAFYDRIVVNLGRPQTAEIFITEEESMDWIYRDAALRQGVEPLIYSSLAVIGVLLVYARRMLKRTYRRGPI